MLPFQLHLQGPDRIRLDSVFDKSTRVVVKAAFLKEYCVYDDTSRYISEANAFDRLALLPRQTL